MIRKIEITKAAEAKKVLETQLPAYRVEAELIGFYGIPPLHDTVETLLACGETFYGYYEEGCLCGIISFKYENSTVDIHRLAVHPDHFRKGIAEKLLSHIEGLHGNAEGFIVSTGSGNNPAITFYEKRGFRRTGEIQVAESLSLITFRKACSANT